MPSYGPPSPPGTSRRQNGLSRGVLALADWECWPPYFGRSISAARFRPLDFGRSISAARFRPLDFGRSISGGKVSPGRGGNRPHRGRSYRGMTKFRNTYAALLIGATAFLGLAQVADRRPRSGEFRAWLSQFRLSLPGLSARHLAMRPLALYSRFDYLGRWSERGTRVAAPGASFASTASRYPASVSQVVFAGASDGWAYGNSLWATYNGGHTWRRLSLGGPVLSLDSSARVAYALVGNCSPNGDNCQAPELRLERSTVGSRSWQTVPDVSGYGTSAIIAANGENAWVSLLPRNHGAAMVWTTTDGGAKWRSLPDSCYQPAQATDLAGLASPGGSTVFELCAGNPGAGQEGKSLRILERRRVNLALCQPTALGGAGAGNCRNWERKCLRDGRVGGERRL